MYSKWCIVDLSSSLGSEMPDFTVSLRYLQPISVKRSVVGGVKPAAAHYGSKNSAMSTSTGAERVVTLKMEIPGSMPPLIEEMLEDLQNLENDQKKRSEERAEQNTSQYTHTVSSRYMTSSGFLF